MALESDWLALANDTLTVEPATGVTDYGAPTYGTAWTAAVTVQNARKIVVFKDGKSEVSTTQLFVYSSSGHIGLSDRLSWAGMLPGSTNPPRILSADHASDEDGQHHIEVALG